MADLSAGRASVPPRPAAVVPEVDGRVPSMSGFVPSQAALVTKLVSVFPRNAGTARPTHQAVVVVFDPATGSPVALLDGEEITAARTAAGSALSARLVAREDAAVLAILGTGVQARAHARALPLVREIREIRVAGRSLAGAEAVARELGEELDGVAVGAAASYADAMLGADVVCATTAAQDPVVRRRWLSPGTHITSVGFTAARRAGGDETIRDVLVGVESRAAVLAPPLEGSNDLLQPIRDGVISEAGIHAEIGELVLGRRAGRTDAAQITLYKSVGVAVQDAAAAALVLAAARAQGAGVQLAL